MRKLVFLAMAVIAFSACSKKEQYIIQGTVTNDSLNDKTLILQEIKEGQITASDTVVIKGNAFTFKGNCDSVTIKSVYVKDADVVPFVFFTEKGTITVQINDRTTTVGGTPLNDKFQVFNNGFQGITQKGQVLFNEYTKKQEAGTATEEDETQLRDNLSKLANENTKNLVNFAKENANNILGQYCFMNFYYRLAPEVQEEMLSFATPEIKALLKL